MWWFIFLISLVTIVSARPQQQQQQQSPGNDVESPIGHNFPYWQPQPIFHNQYYGNYLLPNDIQTNFIPSIPQPQFHFQRYYQPLSIETDSKEDVREKEIRKNSSMETARVPVVDAHKAEIRIKDVSDGKQDLQLPPVNMPASLAPFRAHPLFHYIKNRNTIDPNKVITFRRSNDLNAFRNEDVTTLILKPVARAVAGVDGKAISTPLSKAILRQGTNVDILFEPEAVAIAGPGGVAHAESDLEIMYEDI